MNTGITVQNNMNVINASFRVVITKFSDNEYIAEIPSIKHCIVSGETIEEAMRYINEVLDAMLEVMQEDGTPIPNDSNLIEYSITKQLPNTLAQQLETA